jgi:hypothetical protein
MVTSDRERERHGAVPLSKQRAGASVLYLFVAAANPSLEPRSELAQIMPEPG